VIEDLTRDRGMLQGMFVTGNRSPGDFTLSFGTRLRSMTHGRASFSAEYAGYHGVPSDFKVAVLTEKKKITEIYAEAGATLSSSDVYKLLLFCRLCRWYSLSRGPMRCFGRLGVDFPPVATVPVAFLSFCGGDIEIVCAAVGGRIKSARHAPGGHRGHVIWTSASPNAASHLAAMERRGARLSRASWSWSQ
jgi:hypothetical protein